ncbi:hypothetical protein KKG24_04670, partial [Patescibacteria group bacterium]|nr:hypothetical protein [Patescibacteria group bacterium]
AHSHINASTTAPITYTSTSAQTTQADFEASGAGGFGYSATTTPDSVVGNDDLGVFRSAPFDLGAKTKLSTATFTKGGSARVFARNGSVASISPVGVKRTSQVELEAGSGTGWIALANGSIASQDPELLVNGNMELNSNWFAYGAGISVAQVAAPHSGSYSFRGVDSSPPDVNKGIKSSPFTTITGRTYFITGWIWYDGGDSLGHDLYFGSGDGTILTYLQRRNPASNWLQYSAFYTETNGGNNAYVVVRHNSSFYRTFYIDDFSVKEIHTSSNYESDTFELSSSAQGDRLLVQANVPASTTLSYKIRSGETAVPDGSWSGWTLPTSVVTGLNVFDVSALTGKYWRIGFDGTSDGSATWTMGGFSIVPKAPNYSSLIEIVNPADIQNLLAEKYVQWLAFGDTTWNVDGIQIDYLRSYVDLGVLSKLAGVKAKMSAGGSVDGIVASPEDMVAYTNLNYNLFENLTPIIQTGNDFEVTLPIPLAGRWVVVSFTGEITELEVYHRLAKSDGLSYLADAIGVELPSSGSGDELSYIMTLPSAMLGGAPSSAQEYRFYAPIKDIGVSGSWVIQVAGDGANYIEISADGSNWFSAAQFFLGISLGGALQGGYKSFFLRANAPSGVLGNKQASLKFFIVVGE